MNVTFPEPDLHLDAARRDVFRRIRRRRRGRTVTLAAAVLVAGAVGTGGTLVVQQVSHHAAATGVVCFAHDDLQSLSGTAALADATDARKGTVSSPASADKPELCGLVWRSGLKEAASHGGQWPDIDPNTSTLPIPRLAYCLLNDGMTGGFPIEAPSSTAAQVCDRLGLRLDPALSD